MSRNIVVAEHFGRSFRRKTWRRVDAWRVLFMFVCWCGRFLGVAVRGVTGLPHGGLVYTTLGSGVGGHMSRSDWDAAFCPHVQYEFVSLPHIHRGVVGLPRNNRYVVVTSRLYR